MPSLLRYMDGPTSGPQSSSTLDFEDENEFPFEASDPPPAVFPNEPVIPFLAGDGIGPEILAASRPLLDAAVKAAYGGERRLIWQEVYAGDAAMKQFGERLPGETLEAFRKFRIGLKGPLATPVGGGFRSLNVALRQALDLYASVRPIRGLPGVPSLLPRPEDLNIVIFRENTEDVYAGYEWAADSQEARRLRDFLQRELAVRIREDAGIGVKVTSRFGSRRLILRALRYALQKGKSRLTLVHKGNIMKYTEGAFCSWGYELAEEVLGPTPGPSLQVQDVLADAMFQEICLRPEAHQVVATLNVNGDYLADAAAALVGGVGLAPGGNVGDRCAVFEPTHGTAPTLAGTNRANPCSMILSGAMMLEHMGWEEASNILLRAVERTLADQVFTPDLARRVEGAREVSTDEFSEEVLRRMI